MRKFSILSVTHGTQRQSSSPAIVCQFSSPFKNPQDNDLCITDGNFKTQRQTPELQYLRQCKIKECGVYIVYVIESAAYRVFIHELFVSKTRTSEVRASEGF